jgi:hypothetical protein
MPWVTTNAKTVQKFPQDAHRKLQLGANFVVSYKSFDKFIMNT